MVQTEIQRRKQIGKKYSASTQFASKLICEDCGGFFEKKIWHSTSKYAREIYQCNSKFLKKRVRKISKRHTLLKKKLKQCLFKHTT